jgi:hypothetical protein
VVPELLYQLAMQPLPLMGVAVTNLAIGTGTPLQPTAWMLGGLLVACALAIVLGIDRRPPADTNDETTIEEKRALLDRSAA